MTGKEKREWVRENLPWCAGVGAAMSDVFGEGVRITYAKENGYEFGRPCDIGVRLSETVIGPMRPVSRGRSIDGK
jgi:hypothetical protein